MVRSDFEGGSFKTIADLKGQNILAVRGYMLVQMLKDAGFSPYLVDTDENMLKMLARKRGDVILVGKENAQYLIRMLKFGAEFKFLPIDELPRGDLFMCFSKKYPGFEQLRDKFNEGLKAIRANGTYDTIHAKYR